MQLVSRKAFTLIELSIVLVVIGLIVGGVLVGRDLISAAAVRSQISQIEQFQTAVNTFRGAYGFLPGDMPVAEANKFGLTRTGTGCEEVSATFCGDGNGLIGNFAGDNIQTGESHLFWLDLSQKGLIPFSPVVYEWIWTADTNVHLYVPPAKLGAGFFMYVWYGGVLPTYASDPDAEGDGRNYLSLAAVTRFTRLMFADAHQYIRVSDAYNIDKKMDDGLPQSGVVTAMYGGRTSGGADVALWAVPDGSFVFGGPTTAATPATDATCYDNGNVIGPQKYSVTTNNGGGTNCGLSFRLQ